MARLPVVSQNELNGALPSLQVVAPDDMGLGALARGVERFDNNLDEAAQKKAREALNQADSVYNADYEQAKTLYDGSTPEFAMQMGELYNTHIAGARKGLKGRELKFFDEENAVHKNQRMGQAMTHQSRILGSVERDQVEAQRQSRQALSLLEFKQQTQEKARADALGDEMLKPDYETRSLEEFDARAKAWIESAPETERAELARQLLVHEIDYKVHLRNQGFFLRDEAIRADVTKGIELLVKNVVADPRQLNEAIMEAQKLAGNLPIDVRQKTEAQIPNTMYSAVADGFIAKDDFYGLQAFLGRPEAKVALSSASYERYLSHVTRIETSGYRAVEQQSVNEDLNNELMLIAKTGEGGQFDTSRYIKAFGPIEGPVMAAQAKVQIKQAQEDYGLIKNAAKYPVADFMASLDSLKPKAGDPEYASKMARYDRAVAMGRSINDARIKDPSLAVATNSETAQGWTNYRTGVKGSANAWAATTLLRQEAWGIDKQSRKILPEGVTASMIDQYQSTPIEKRGEAARVLWGEVSRFEGAYRGQVVRELTKAGLPSVDASVMLLSEGSPQILGNYARAQAMAKVVKLTKAEDLALIGAVDKVMQPFSQSYDYSPDAQIYADNVRQAAVTLAKSYRHEGMNGAEAAKAAFKLLTGGYVFEKSYRIPKHIAEARVEPPVNLFNPFTLIKIKQSEAIAHGAHRFIKDYAVNNTNLLQAEEAAPHLTSEQKQKIMADRIIDQGRWINSVDDKGLNLVIPDNRGGWRRVYDAKGRPISKTWDELSERATKGVE